VKVLTYFEIDVTTCSLTYGTSPCTASIPTTGDRKCFNSLGTCQDRDNFGTQLTTFRFAVPCGYLPRDIEALPYIAGVSISPGTISLGKNMGIRSTVDITFTDGPSPDPGPRFDKYPETRGYDPYKRGTFWGKFRARHPYLVGRTCRLIRGVLGQAIEDMETRHFIIDSFNGPTPGNTFTITAKDALRLATGDRAQAPVLSSGRLSASIDDNDLACVLEPSGIGNEEYPASGYACIGGNEIVSFTRSGDNMTIVRAQLGSTASSHSDDDRVQIVLSYVSQSVADIIYDLLVNYAGINPDYIDLPTWQSEASAFLVQLYTCQAICEPTAVDKLINELIEQAALALWWDEVEQQIRFQVLRNVAVNPKVWDNSNIPMGTLNIQEQPDLRISHCYTFYAVRDPTKSLEQEDNYRSSSLDIAVEELINYGAPAIKKIYSRWIPFGGRAIAENLNALQLARFKRPPRKVSFEVFRFNDNAEIGVAYSLESHSLQDDTGELEALPFQVTRLRPQPDRLQIEGEELIFNESSGSTDRYIYIDSNTSQINLRTIHDTFYPVPTDADVGVISIYVVITNSVLVLSTSVADPAIEVGDWPLGLAIDVAFDGCTIRGRDGNGGKGGNGGGPGAVGGNGSNGTPGGTAFRTRKAITVRGLTGKIYGGRGGGGGGGGGAGAQGIGASFTIYNFGGSGAGGGAGIVPGARGTDGGSPGSDGSPGGTTTGGSGGANPSGNAYADPGGGGRGGDAGDYGAAGDNGASGGSGTGNISGTKSGGSPGTGGDGGDAIDGVSYITFAETPTDIRGAQIN
jgi:hypothetical protein